MQMHRWQYVVISFVVAGGLAFLRWERRLDSCLGDCIKTYHYRAGRQRIVLTVTADQQGDNGSATIAITTDANPPVNLTAYFNYDTLIDIPAGYVHYWWQDGDLYPDLLITPTDPIAGNRYYLGSRDGQLYWVEQ